MLNRGVTITNTPMNRYDMAMVLFNIIDANGKRVSSDETNARISEIKDIDVIAANYLSYSTAILQCYCTGIIGGIDGKFCGEQNMTRAQACTVIQRMMVLIDVSAPANLDFSAEYMSSPYYRALQEVVLTGDYRKDVLAVAASQIGYQESNAANQLDGSYLGYGNFTEYGRYLGSNGSAWCSEFASWCARAARVPTSLLDSSLAANIEWFGAPYYTWSQTVYAGGTYTPRPGDLALFAWNGTSHTASNLSHTAIVYNVKVQNDTVIITVIEGNSDNAVRMGTYTANISDGNVAKGYLVYFVAPEYD